MQCLKCGREVEKGKVFCDDCLAVMETSPVKPGTPVVLPRREEQSRRAAIRTQPKPEETIRLLERTIRNQRIALICVTVLFTAVTALLCWLLWEANAAAAIGSNYTTIPTA